MRKNTKHILLAHYDGSSTPGENTRRTYQFLYDVFSESSPEGVRTITNQLVQKKYLNRYQSEGKSIFELSQMGLQKIFKEYPILRTRSRKKELVTSLKTNTSGFQLCVFLEPPQSDIGFRRLRKKIELLGGVQLARGNYVIPTQTSGSAFLDLLILEYSSSILLIECLEFSLGYPDRLLFQKQNQLKLIRSFSEISDQSLKLLENFGNKKDSLFKMKYKMSSFFYSIIEELDNQQYLFPGEKKELQVILQAFSNWSVLVKNIYFSR